jgi:hypothetical protein
MILWWQAILIGLAPSLATGAVAFLVQQFQYRHELALQGQRTGADRLARQEAVMREHLRERAKPLYEFLEIVERDQSRRFLRGSLLADGTRDRAWQVVKDHIDRPTFDAVWLEMVAADTAAEIRWQDVVKRYSGRFFTVGDEKLRDCLFKLLMHVAAGEAGAFTASEISTLLIEAKGRIELGFVEARLPYLVEEQPAN